MSLYWGLSINDDSKIECALCPFVDQINLCTADAGSWGLGYYHAGELLKRIDPKKQGEPLDVMNVMSGIKADIVIMHTRRATVGPVRRENTHPFRFKEWIFAHNGTLAGFEAFKARLSKVMPPFILRGVKGDTDSEYLFHLFLSFLYDSGFLGRPDLGIVPIRDALNRALATVDEFAKEVKEQPSPASIIVSDGYSLVVLNRGIPVEYALIESVRDCPICRKSIQPGDMSPPQVDHEKLRAVLVRSGSTDVLSPGDGLQTLKENSFLMVTKTHGVEFSDFI